MTKNQKKFIAVNEAEVQKFLSQGFSLQEAAIMAADESDLPDGLTKEEVLEKIRSGETVAENLTPFGSVEIPKDATPEDIENAVEARSRKILAEGLAHLETDEEKLAMVFQHLVRIDMERADGTFSATPFASDNPEGVLFLIDVINHHVWNGKQENAAALFANIAAIETAGFDAVFNRKPKSAADRKLIADGMALAIENGFSNYKFDPEKTLPDGVTIN